MVIMHGIRHRKLLGFGTWSDESNKVQRLIMHGFEMMLAVPLEPR